ncbi:MAG: endonuclease/exonuclease/phosphatase family protein [Gammaproteobacteria bacterium]|nr:endonuclease/exonuclease/phosphatase family protein [Gammaproteobacteria bacterium]
MKAAKPFRLLSYNIQLGLRTEHYGHYVTGAWRHALPARTRRANLLRMAAVMRGYDFVAIQEADAGSLRTGQLNLVEFLAEHAGFKYCGLTVTRDFAPFARFCLGYLSRTAPVHVVAHSLPGRVPGRGALEVDLDSEALGGLTMLVTHLSLGRDSRARQLGYLAAAARGRRAVLVGDMNAGAERLARHPALHVAGLRPLSPAPPTFPSWRPRRALDQVLLSPDLRALSAQTLPALLSDHLPLAVEVARAA